LLLIVIGGVFAAFALAILAVILMGLFLGVAIGFGRAALIYQRDAFARDQRWRDADALTERLDDSWSAMHRYATLYAQYQQWAAILDAEVYMPVGRLGRLVVFGAQQTAPRWLVTARSASVKPGKVGQLQRITFKRGWRVRSYRSVEKKLLDEYQEEEGFDVTLDPESDVFDQKGAREHLVASFVLTNRASARKREELEQRLRDRVVESGAPLDRLGDVERIEGRYDDYLSLSAFFDLSADDSQRFAGFLFGPDGPFGGVERVDRVPEHVEIVAPGGYSGSGTIRVKASQRLWPRLVAARLDYSHPMIPGRDGGISPLSQPSGFSGPVDPEKTSKGRL